MRFIVYWFTVSSLCFAAQSNAMGIADWAHQTPGGNTMADPGSGTELSMENTNEYISGIRKWYFYKGFVIGTTYEDFFIVNEQTGDVRRFSSNTDWTKFIQQSGLKPIVWTRWYTDNWVNQDAILFLLLIFSPIWIPMLLVYAIFACIAISKKRFSPNPNFIIVLRIVVIIYLLVVILDAYPESI